MQTSEQCIIFCQNHSCLVLGILLVVYTEKLKAGHTLETNIRWQSIAFVSRNLSCLGQCHFRRLGSFGK